jgi:hypothetical protein
MTLDEIVAAMSKAGIEGSRAAVWRFYERHDISFKKNFVRGGARARRGRRGRGPSCGRPFKSRTIGCRCRYTESSAVFMMINESASSAICARRSGLINRLGKCIGSQMRES